MCIAEDKKKHCLIVSELIISKLTHQGDKGQQGDSGEQGPTGQSGRPGPPGGPGRPGAKGELVFFNSMKY